MGYYGMMGAVDASNWVAVKNGAIVKPRNWPTLGLFRELQHQMNRAAQAGSLGKIAPDGDIGPATVGLWKKLWAGQALENFGPADIAKVADTAAPVLAERANKAGVPAKISEPTPTKPPSIVQPDGKELTAPPDAGGGGIMATLSSMSETTKMLLGAGVAVGAFLFFRKKKRG